MSYIYVITNDINGKQYVGKTNNSIKERFKEHISDSKKEKCEKRPLYNAMNKYGIEHFSVEQLEECPYEEANIKEIYWIGKLDTYNNGYNATLGGDSRHYYNYQEIANKYLELQNQEKTAKYFNCDVDTIRRACRQCNVKIISGQQKSKEKNGKKINMLSLKGEVLKSFNDMSDAARWLRDNKITTAQVKNISCNIGRVARGIRTTAYNYKWEFIKE